MYDDSAIFRKQFAEEDKPLIHKLEILVISPNVSILLFLKGGTIAHSLSDTFEINFLFIVGLAVEWRINVN